MSSKKKPESKTATNAEPERTVSPVADTEPPTPVVETKPAPKPVPYALEKFRGIHGKEPLCLVLNPTSPALKDRHGFDVELDAGAGLDVVGLCIEKANDKIGGVQWFKRSEWE